MLAWEKEYLRDIAKKKAEIANSPEMQEKIKQWYLHNDLKSDIPIIYFEMGTVGDAGFNYSCKCESSDARGYEWNLGNEMQNYIMIGDDRAVTADYTIGYGSGMKLFNLDAKRTNTDGIGFHIDPVIKNLDTLDQIQPSPMWYDDKANAAKWFEQAQDLFGDILNVRYGQGSLYFVPTNNLVQLMSMETMFTEMYDNPDNFHEMMKRLADDCCKYMKGLEEREMLLPSCRGEWVAQGTFAFTHDLPEKKDTPFTLKDVWGFMDSQETVGVSKEMFHEFFFPYYKQISENFGLLSYGCCEPVDTFWEDSISKFENLRKVSISPWCDEEKMGEYLRERKNVIYQRKPSPLYIGGTEKELDEEAFREHIRKTMKAARGCKLEITFRDTYTLNGNFNKPRRAVEIVREEIVNTWQS